MRMIKLILVLFLAIAGNIKAQTGNSANAIVSEEFIFPCQNKHVHSSSIVMLSDGSMLAVWYQGSGERTSDDVMLMGARLKKGMKVWSDPFLMADTKEIPDCNPVLYLNKKGKLFLFWVAVVANRWEDALLRYRTSTNYSGNGAPVWEWQDDILLKPDDNFAKEVEKRFDELDENNNGWSAYAPRYDNMIKEASHDLLKRSLGWMTRIPPISLENGRILLPLYSDGFNFSIVAISDDDGTTWKPSLPIVGRGPIQPSLTIRNDKTIVAFMRDSGDSPNRVQVSTSADNGESWTASVKTEIPCEASVATCVLADGKWVMVLNDINGGRYELALYLSDDEGATWKWKQFIENDPERKGSYSYPCLIQTSDGMLNLSYSYSSGKDKNSIKHVVIDPSVIVRE